jgi:hypothetical protein
MQGLLTSAIALWRFGTPLGLQLPKWKLTWECESSSSHSLTLLLARTLANLRFGREPKAKVTTIIMQKTYIVSILNLLVNYNVTTIVMISSLITNFLNKLVLTWWKWWWPLGEPSTLIRFLKTLTIMLSLTSNSNISGTILECWGLMSPLLGGVCYPMCISLIMFIANVVVASSLLRFFPWLTYTTILSLCVKKVFMWVMCVGDVYGLWKFAILKIFWCH